MPQYSDDLWLGGANGPQSQGWAGPGQVYEGVGPLGRVYIYDIVPATISATAVSAAQAIAAAGNALINGTSATGGVATFNVCRNVSIVSSSASDTTPTAKSSERRVHSLVALNTSSRGTSTTTAPTPFSTRAKAATLRTPLASYSSVPRATIC